MKLFLITKSNIKKNKSMTIALVVLIIFATMLLYIGTSVVMNIDTFLDDKNKELNGAEFILITPDILAKQIQTVIEESKELEKLEVENVVFGRSWDYRNITKKEKSQNLGFIFFNADNKSTISTLKIIDEGDKKRKNSIILPYYLKKTKGYKTGDEIAIGPSGNENRYVIYGFSEDIMFAVPSNLAFYKCFVYDEEFQQLYQSYQEEAHAVLMRSKLTEGTDTSLYSDNIYEALDKHSIADTQNLISLDYTNMKTGVSIFLIIIMAILIVFSLIIITIALTMMRFAIITHIEGNVKNIGSMEALGYTGKQLVAGTVYQFTLISVIGTLFGIVLAAACLGAITNIVSSSIGLAWNMGIDPLSAVISCLVILLLVVAISYIAASKIKKITPIVALRSGIDTHNFKRNHLPLDKSRFSMNTTLGLKAFMHNMKQNITIMIIVALMSFVTVFAFTAYYNFNMDNMALIRLVGIEKAELQVKYDGEDYLKLFDEIKSMGAVRKTLRLAANSMAVTYGDREVTPLVSICEDYSRVDINTIVSGRYPVHDNEIALTSLMIDRLGAKIGNTVSMKGNGIEEEFMIVGITQQITNLGRGASITEQGMLKITPKFKPSLLYIYLNDGYDLLEVKKQLEKNYQGKTIVVANMEEMYDTILGSFNSATYVLCVSCIIITISIISLILYLLIKIKLLKDRMRIGVSKSIGYTTSQILKQVIISFCPATTLGALIGVIAAAYLINPAFAAMLSISGIVNSHLIINPLLTLITFLSITLFAVFVTGLVAMRVRRITPCELFI